MKDFVFGNASIGKKIVGIEIYNDNWEKPKFMLLLIRTFFMLAVGSLILYRAKLVDGEIIQLFDWEREIFKTRVIDKKILKELQNEANRKQGDYCTNMTNLYNEYLRSVYIK